MPADGLPQPPMPGPLRSCVDPPQGPGVVVSSSLAGSQNREPIKPLGWRSGRPSLKAIAMVRHTRSASSTPEDAAREAAAVRPPSVLLRVCDYLFGIVVDADKHGFDERFDGGRPNLLEIHEFVFNRSRAVRKHLSTQGFKYG